MPTLLGQKTGFSSTLGVEKKGNTSVFRKKTTKVWYVLSDNTSQDEDDILVTTGLPAYYATDNGAFVVSKSAQEIQRCVHPTTGSGCHLWEVAVEYDSNVSEADNQHPLNKPATVRWHGENFEKVLEKDAITGEPIQTKAGERIHATRPVCSPVLEITRYEAYPFNPVLFLEYANHTNSTTFWGAPEGSALMLPMEVDEETLKPNEDDPPEKYAVVTYRIQFQFPDDPEEEGWKFYPLHQGTLYTLPAEIGTAIANSLDAYGQPKTINLDEDGGKLPDGDPPNYLEFNRYPKVNFNTLSLGPF